MGLQISPSIHTALITSDIAMVPHVSNSAMQGVVHLLCLCFHQRTRANIQQVNGCMWAKVMLHLHCSQFSNYSRIWVHCLNVLSDPFPFFTLTSRKQKANVSYVLLTLPFDVLPYVALYYISYFNSFLEAGRLDHFMSSSLLQSDLPAKQHQWLTPFLLYYILETEAYLK